MRPLACAVALSLLLAASASKAQSVLEQARETAAAGDTGTALAQVDAWLAGHPADHEAQFLRARLLAWSGEFDASRRAYDELLSGDPDNVDYLFGRAQAWLWSGDADRALADIGTARAIAPDYAELDPLERQARAARSAPAQTPMLATDLPAPVKPREVVAAVAWESLDNGYDDWSSAAVRAQMELSPGTLARGALLLARRYGSSETELGLGASWLPDRRWELGADLTAAGNSEFLPQWSGSAYALLRVTATTILRTGFRHAEYDLTRNETLSVGLEQYYRRYRFAYSLFRGDPADADANFAHVLRGDLFYGDTSSVGVQYAFGKESETDGRGGLLVSRVRGAALLGRHRVKPQWSLFWALTWHEQGDLYRRAGIDVGLAHQF